MDMRSQRHFSGSRRAAGDVRLHSGIRIELRGLTQRLTYEGLLEGLPLKRSNDHLLETLVRRTDPPDPWGNRVLIEPERRLIERNAPYHAGIAEALPRVCCIGRFQSRFVVKEPSAFASSATLVWFQEDWALPIASEALEKIRTLDWSEIAADIEL